MTLVNRSNEKYTHKKLLKNKLIFSLIIARLKNTDIWLHLMRRIPNLYICILTIKSTTFIQKILT